MTLVVPDRCGASTREDINHFLEDLALWLQLLAGCNLHHIAVVGGARGFVIDVHPLATATGPWLEVHRVEVSNIVGADDVQPLILHPAGVGCFFFGCEFRSQVFGYKSVFCHIGNFSYEMSVWVDPLTCAGSSGFFHHPEPPKGRIRVHFRFAPDRSDRST